MTCGVDGKSSGFCKAPVLLPTIEKSPRKHVASAIGIDRFHGSSRNLVALDSIKDGDSRRPLGTDPSLSGLSELIKGVFR